MLDRSVIAIPLLEKMNAAEAEARIGVIFDVNLEYSGGLDEGRQRVLGYIASIVLKEPSRALALERLKDTKRLSHGEADKYFGSGLRVRQSVQFVFAKLTPSEIVAVVQTDAERARQIVKKPGVGTATPAEISLHRAIFRVWPDFRIKALLTKSASTIKATAAGKAFDALGRDIVWAIVDSGIDGKHVHFAKHDNLKLPSGIAHRDFVGDGKARKGVDPALTDPYGHGTHVAGIVAGEYLEEKKQRGGASTIYEAAYQRTEEEDPFAVPDKVSAIAGIAPMCKLLSLRVIDEGGFGDTSSIIEALMYVHELNGFGRFTRVHGVNISLGYEFNPEWFACGQSPLCVAVDRLVRAGVVVVIAAGNSGFGEIKPDLQEMTSAGLMLTINDPGNAERAITVGSTHRDMPHLYGISYFSSKGPTGDGRRKPDIVAPGEKIVSCAAGAMLSEARDAVRRGDPSRSVTSASQTDGRIASRIRYVESSGTSMAAPHVSGAIAAFLSIRQEFIGQPDRVKQIFMESATDLGRETHFQGRGLVDLMRAIQSI
jgi:subtilisin family serine protease